MVGTALIETQILSACPLLLASGSWPLATGHEVKHFLFLLNTNLKDEIQVQIWVLGSKVQRSGFPSSLWRAWDFALRASTPQDSAAGRVQGFRCQLVSGFDSAELVAGWLLVAYCRKQRS
jgi:hypothetical protein